MMSSIDGLYVFDVRLINDHKNRDIPLMRVHSIGELFDTLPDTLRLHRWTSDEETRTGKNGKIIQKELTPESLRDFVSICKFKHGREGLHLYVRLYLHQSGGQVMESPHRFNWFTNERGIR